MADYTYMVTGLRAGEVREELPVNRASFSFGLQTDGGMNLSTPLYTSRTGFNKIRPDVIQPGASALWTLRDGVPFSGHIIWKASGSVASRTLTITGRDYLSYLKSRIVANDKTYSDLDEFEIIRQLIDDMQFAVVADIGLEVSADNSGTTASREIFQAQQKTFWDVLDDMSSGVPGFEFSQEVTGSPQGGFVPTLSMAPNRGRSSTNLRLELGKNLESLTYTEDANRMANRVLAVGGGGDGEDAIRAIANDVDARAIYPFLDTGISRRGVESLQVLRSHAEAELEVYARLRKTLSLVITQNDPDFVIGSFELGDVVQVVADYGFIQINAPYRILGYDLDVDQDGQETVKLKVIEQ